MAGTADDRGVTAAFPPAPWRLRGDAVIVPARTRDKPTPGDADPGPRGVPGGAAFGGVVLARYRRASTLAYHELVVFSGVARLRLRLGLMVCWIAVDSPSSLAGGQAIWALPKRLARFTWTDDVVTVAEAETPVLRAHVRRRIGRVPLPVVAPFFGQADGRFAYTLARGWLAVAPAIVELEVPGGSPLNGLGIEGRRVGLVARDLDLVVPAPRPPHSRQCAR
jgi:acetoacetate decarboxylase